MVISIEKQVKNVSIIVHQQIKRLKTDGKKIEKVNIQGNQEWTVLCYSLIVGVKIIYLDLECTHKWEMLKLST